MDPQFFTELLKQGGLAILAAAFAYAYVGERSERKDVQKRLEEQMVLRIGDGKENLKDVAGPLDNISQVLKLIDGKIQVSKGRR